MMKLSKAPCRSIRPGVFLDKVVLSICSKFTGEHQFRSVILIKLLRSFIEIALQHGCSFLNLFHIFRTPLDCCHDNYLAGFLVHLFVETTYFDRQRYQNTNLTLSPLLSLFSFLRGIVLTNTLLCA